MIGTHTFQCSYKKLWIWMKINSLNKAQSQHNILSSILNVLLPVLLLQYTTFFRIGNIYLIRDVVKSVVVNKFFYVKKEKLIN